ncbi:MAG: hypothetical protein FJ102_25490 [Deltaproteobacteria bacterium]|nr:hypothetical protein [Deltaproteobacteria bacterium]
MSLAMGSCEVYAMLFVSIALASPLGLPVPTAPLCPGAPVVASYAAGSDVDYPEVGREIPCDDEAECLAAIRRLGDPRDEIRAQRSSLSPDDSDDLDPENRRRFLAALDTTVSVELACIGTPARAEWRCDAAGCTLDVTRSAPVDWGRVAVATVPVGELVSLDDQALVAATPVLAALVVEEADRMSEVLDRCERGGCRAGWRPLQAYLGAFATEPQLVSVSRDVWGAAGFIATFAPGGDLRPAGMVAELECLDLPGDCGMSGVIDCSLSLARDGERIVTGRDFGTEVRWSEGYFQVAMVGDTLAFRRPE